jgi:hypothetical protein
MALRLERRLRGTAVAVHDGAIEDFARAGLEVVALHALARNAAVLAWPASVVVVASLGEPRLSTPDADKGRPCCNLRFFYSPVGKFRGLVKGGGRFGPGEVGDATDCVSPVSLLERQTTYTGPTSYLRFLSMPPAPKLSASGRTLSRLTATASELVANSYLSL